MSTTVVHPAIGPSPLDVGGTLTGAFRVMKRRLGQLVVLTLIPVVVAILLVTAATVALVFGIVASIQESALNPVVILGGVLFLASVIVSGLVQVKVQGMMTLGAHDEIHGRRSTMGELAGRTRGIVGRVLLLYVLAAVAVLLVFGLLMTFMIVSIGAAATGGGESAAAGAAVAILVFVLFYFAFVIAAIYFGVRLLYTLPSLAVEGTRAVEALKRSWSLTRGNVLRTLGYYLLASLLISVISGVISGLAQMVTLPAASTPAVSDDPQAIFASLGLVAPFLIVIGLLEVALMLFVLPYITCYVTVMYVDQLRRNDLPPRGAYGPVPGNRPPQQWGQPQQPQQGGQQQPQQWGQPQQPQQWGQPQQPQQWGQSQQPGPGSQQPHPQQQWGQPQHPQQPGPQQWGQPGSGQQGQWGQPT